MVTFMMDVVQDALPHRYTAGLEFYFYLLAWSTNFIDQWSTKFCDECESSAKTYLVGTHMYKEKA